jgi:hypothetical protein
MTAVGPTFRSGVKQPMTAVGPTLCLRAERSTTAVGPTFRSGVNVTSEEHR